MEDSMGIFARRRSVRAYTNEDVSDANIRQILQAGILAPSGKNLQGMRFAVLRGTSCRRQALTALHPRSRAVMNQAPALVAVLQDTGCSYHVVKDAQTMGACMENMLLAATLLGLGSLWLGEAVDSQAAVLKALELPQDRYIFHAVLCFGHARGEAAVMKRKPLEDYMLP